MKKIITIIIVAVVIAAIITVGVLYFVNRHNEAKYIGQDAAKAAALSDAGLTADKVRLVECKLDRENKTTLYEIEFIADALEYEYKIDAVSGNILWKETDNAYD